MKLLSLSDESLAMIFDYLGAFDTTGSFNHPRHAFALAQTNTRLLRIFCDHFTCITPQIKNHAPPTLSPSHLLTVIRLFGYSLLELHLPKTSLKILPHVFAHCTRLRKLVFIDSSQHRHTNTFEKSVGLPVRSLSIQYPSQSAIRAVRTISHLEELCLTKLLLSQIDDLMQILGNPPKKLRLEFLNEGEEPTSELLSCLQAACPQTEELAVTMLRPFPIPFEDLDNTNCNPLMKEAIRILEQPRHNTDSKCKKMTLEGNIMELIQHAHPKAMLEITRGATTIISDENRIFLKRIHIGFYTENLIRQKFILTQDLSHLEDVLLGAGFMVEWDQRLSNLQLNKISVSESIRTDEWHFHFRARTVSLQPQLLDGRTNWRWLSHAKNVEVINCRSYLKPVSNMAVILHFFKSLRKLIIQFSGKIVWLDSCCAIPAPKHNSHFRTVVRNLRLATNDFEACGGDAATVRALIERIEWM